jgi:hypothetical protein
MSYHASNKKCKEIFIAGIPWPLSEDPSPVKNGDGLVIPRLRPAPP